MISSLSPPLSGGLFHPLVSRSPISIRPAVIREGWREIPSENQEAEALGEILSLEGGELDALVKDRAAKSGWKVTGDVIQLGGNELKSKLGKSSGSNVLDFAQYGPLLGM